MRLLGFRGPGRPRVGATVGQGEVADVARAWRDLGGPAMQGGMRAFLIA